MIWQERIELYFINKGEHRMRERNSNKILLESGTNEIEIMEFTIDGNLYGINVAKVREIMMSDVVKPMPHVHPAVEGIFKPRDVVMTVINLPKYLDGNTSKKEGRDLFIVTNFNKMHLAFRVHTVEGIVRISWGDIQKPDKTIYGGKEGVATGIAQYGDTLITILDFEKIVTDIAPETGIQMDEINNLGNRAKNNMPILVAEDSVLLSKMIKDSLAKAGYVNIIKFDNGQEAWDYLCSIQDEANVKDKVSIIITDIEMPKMDGHRLTKLIKESQHLKNIPVIIFSSMINNEMYVKGKQLGADEQISKPEIVHLVEVIDHFLFKK